MTEDQLNKLASLLEEACHSLAQVTLFLEDFDGEHDEQVLKIDDAHARVLEVCGKFGIQF